jgi:hypothetical protein
MHAVVVNVTINDRAAAENELRKPARAVGLADPGLCYRVLDNQG